MFMRSNSWVIVNKITGDAIFETWNENTAKAINTKMYTAMTAYDYLCNLNQKAKNV